MTPKPVDLFLIASCGQLHRDVLALPREFPAGWGKRLGAAIRQTGQWNPRRGCWDYFLLVSPRYPTMKLGLFQVATHLNRRASFDLLATSTACLILWQSYHPEARVALYYPNPDPKAIAQLESVKGLHLWQETYDTGSLLSTLTTASA